jgi:hypothetical protein
MWMCAAKGSLASPSGPSFLALLVRPPGMGDRPRRCGGAHTWSPPLPSEARPRVSKTAKKNRAQIGLRILQIPLVVILHVGLSTDPCIYFFRLVLRSGKPAASAFSSSGWSSLNSSFSAASSHCFRRTGVPAW